MDGERGGGRTELQTHVVVLEDVQSLCRHKRKSPSISNELQFGNLVVLEKVQGREAQVEID